MINTTDTVEQGRLTFAQGASEVPDEIIERTIRLEDVKAEYDGYTSHPRCVGVEITKLYGKWFFLRATLWRA